MSSSNQQSHLASLEEMVQRLPVERLPRHIAIIMDGNGRWAKAHGLPRSEGHKAGINVVKRIVRFAPRVHTKILTLYTFSTENWRRPKTEVKTLMKLLSETTMRELDELVANGVKLIVSGRFEELPFAQRKALGHAIRKTANGKTLVLNLALNYGGRDEIIDAVRKIANDVRNGNIAPETIDENLFGTYLYTAGLPDPDLLIRTSGELRLSNFLLWQTAYTELFFTEVFWPDFDEAEFCRAIIDFAGRERRFGGISTKREQ